MSLSKGRRREKGGGGREGRRRKGREEEGEGRRRKGREEEGGKGGGGREGRRRKGREGGDVKDNDKHRCRIRWSVAPNGPTSSFIDVLFQPLLAAKVAQFASTCCQEQDVALRSCGCTGVQPVVEGVSQDGGGGGTR